MGNFSASTRKLPTTQIPIKTFDFICKLCLATVNVTTPSALLFPQNDCAHPHPLHTLRHCAVNCYTLAGLYCATPTTSDDNKKVFQLRKEITVLVASFGVHTTVIKACGRRNRSGHRDVGCVGMSKAARNSGTDSYRG